MSNFQWVDIKLPTQVSRIITDTHPAQIQVGGLSGTDSCSLIISLKVGGYVGVGPAVMSVQQTWDDGSTWIALPNTVNVTGVGTFIWRHDNAANGGLSPQVRVVITPPVGESLVIDKLKRTFSPSNTIVPPSISGGGAASEVTLSAINTLLQNESMAVLAAQTAYASATNAVRATSIILGWDATNVTHKELLVDATGGLTLPKYEVVTTPLANRLSDGVDFLTSLAIAAAQTAYATVTKALHTVSVITGWDGTNHREIAVDTSGNLKTIPVSSVERTVANPPLKRDYGASPLLANTWTQIIASTATRARLMDVFDSSGEPIEISFDSGVTVAFQFSPGGNSQIPYTIPAGSTVDIRSLNAVNTVGTYFLLNLLT
jgi:hydrogenase maturation factor